MKNTALYGAILGDIIGSPFEFREVRHKSKDFELFSKESKFTDDTVMTIAIADAILRTGGNKDGRVLFKNVEKSMLYYGKKYPDAGYGGGFRKWLKSENPRPYNSCGNGSAMRISAAGWISDSMFNTREYARTTARPTHNHPEGVKGAMAVASAILLARSGNSKEVIKNYIEYEFDYNLSRSLDEVRKNCLFNETCQVSVPEAIIAFLESKDFEDAIRNAVSLGGDTDTQAAITGSIAEAFYGVPDDLIKKCREYLPKEFLDVIDKFNFGKGYLTYDLENYSLEKKIEEFNKISSEKNYQSVKDEILEMLKKSYTGGNKIFGFFSVLKEGHQVITYNQDEKCYDILYTNFSEILKSKNVGKDFSIAITGINEVFRLFKTMFFDDEGYGLAINPYGENPFFLDRDSMQEILEKCYSDIHDEKRNHVEHNQEIIGFTEKPLSNDLLTEKFFDEDARFINVLWNAGIFEVWTKDFEHYSSLGTEKFDVKKFFKAFMKAEDTFFITDTKNSDWHFYYPGKGQNFYVRKELDEEYHIKFGEILQNGADYIIDRGLPPIEEFMLEVLNESVEDDYIGTENELN